MSQLLLIPYLYVIFFHRQWTVHVVQFVVQSTRIADWFTDLIAAPQRSVGCVAVRALQSYTSCRALMRIVKTESVLETVFVKRTSKQTTRIHGDIFCYRECG